MNSARSKARASVIIPTAGAPARAASLKRAIESILGQTGVDAVPIVVLNGTRFERTLMEGLRADPRIRFFHLEEPGLPSAIKFGRRQVDTPFFGYLDDDDFYQPWALAERIACADALPHVDAVVSRGERETPGGLALVPDEPVWRHRSQPMQTLLHGCWLSSCSGLFVTERITESYFDAELRHLEWTSVALRLCLDRTLHFLESPRPHFRICDSAESLSKSTDYLMGLESSIDRLMALPIPPFMQSGLRRKKADLRHSIAELLFKEGRLSSAWRHHLNSLRHFEGMRYLPSTRHFVRSTIDHWLTRRA